MDCDQKNLLALCIFFLLGICSLEFCAPESGNSQFRWTELVQHRAYEHDWKVLVAI